MFELLFERSADAILLFDPQRQSFVDCNQAAVEMMRAANKQQVITALPDQLCPEFQSDGQNSKAKCAEMTNLALAQGSHRFEWTSRAFDGQDLPVEVVLTSVPLENRPLLLCVLRDISSRKKLEHDTRELNAQLERRVAQRTEQLLAANEQLKAAERESRKRALQAQKHRVVLLELAQLDKSDFNQAVQKICSVAASSLDVARVSYWSLTDGDSAIVCNHLHVLATQSGDDKAKGARLTAKDCPSYFEALATRRHIIANSVLDHPATCGLGETYLKPLGISSMLDAPVWLRGKVVGVLCHEHIGQPREWSAEEIDFASSLSAMVSLALEQSQRAASERLLRESEARFSAAFQASPVFITICRVDNGHYVLANEVFLSWTGYNLSEVVGRTSEELGLWADPSEREPFWAELRRTHSIRERETRVRSRHGETTTALLSADIIEIDGMPHLLTVGLDISHRKQAEAELLRTVAREKELGLLRSKFISMVSHEFRTPLGIIQSSAEILNDYHDRLEGEERADHLQSITKNTRRMAALMEEVLFLGTFDGGKTTLRLAPIDLGQFARLLVDEVHSATNEKCPVELKMEEMPDEALADERLLRHIFTNLLTNAVKYSEAGKTVRIEITRDGADAICTVRDRGIGIPKPDREWLFNAFHRGRNVGDRPGTGLGLVIVKRCVDLHGGEINVDSTEGQGTVMTFRLPVFEDASASYPRHSCDTELLTR